MWCQLACVFLMLVAAITVVLLMVVVEDRAEIEKLAENYLAFLLCPLPALC